MADEAGPAEALESFDKHSFDDCKRPGVVGWDD
jgi:hypothetical protein